VSNDHCTFAHFGVNGHENSNPPIAILKMVQVVAVVLVQTTKQ